MESAENFLATMIIKAITLERKVNPISETMAVTTAALLQSNNSKLFTTQHVRNRGLVPPLARITKTKLSGIG